jgi:hypothetical protein
MQDGAWRYDPETNRLLPHCSGDLRAATGIQDFTATAPLELIYVASRVHLTGLSPGAFDHAPLARALRLDQTQFLTFVQTVGYPKA